MYQQQNNKYTNKDNNNIIMETKKSNKVFEIFQQTELLTTRINNILNDYPPGVTVLREFLQNADDAKASHFGICLDYRNDYSTANLLSSELDQYYNVPSLLIYNSAKFTEKDFQSLISIGNSGKKKDKDSIGRYGLGFNASFHLTDLVSFISGDDLVMFDPHGKSLPNNVLGLRSKWKDLENNKQFNNTVIPFYGASKAFFCSQDDNNTGNNDNINNNVLENGTVFRLPLRTVEQGKSSLLSNESTTVEEAYEMLKNFAENALEALLFLKHVKNISISILDQNGNVETLQETNLTDCKNLMKNKVEQKISNDDDIYKNPRCAISDFLKTYDNEDNNNIENVNEYRAKYILKFKTTSNNNNNNNNKTEKLFEEWLIYSGADTSEIARVSALRADQVPWGGIAIRLTPTERKVEGRAYCFLPLPIVTGLPVHVNAAFALSSDRRNLWTNNDIDKRSKTSKASWKGAWNNYLLEELIPTLYSEACGLLTSLYSENGKEDLHNVQKQSIAFYDTTWPVLAHVQQQSIVFYNVAEQMIKKIACNNIPIFFTNVATPKKNDDIMEGSVKAKKSKGKKNKKKKKQENGNESKNVRQTTTHWISLNKAIFVGKIMDAVFKETQDYQSVENFHLTLARSKIFITSGGESDMEKDVESSTLCLCQVPEFVKIGLLAVVPERIHTTTPQMISSLFKHVDMSLSVVRILLKYFMNVKWFDDQLIDDTTRHFIKLEANQLQIKELESQCVEGPMCFKFLNGLKILPLRPSKRDKNKKTIRFGTFNYSHLVVNDSYDNNNKHHKKKKMKKDKSKNDGKSTKSKNYFIVPDPKYYKLVEESHRIVCFESIPDVQKLFSVIMKKFDGTMQKYNVRELTPQILIQSIGLGNILPKAMQSRPLISLYEDDVVEVGHGNIRMIDQVALMQRHDLARIMPDNSSSISISSIQDDKHLSKKMKKKRKQAKQNVKKNLRKKSNLNASPRNNITSNGDAYAHLLPSEYKIHPDGPFVLSSSLPAINVIKTMECIKLLWEFLSDSTDNLQGLITEKGLNLDTWPLIPILLNGSNDGKYFVSYKYGKLRSLLMKTDKAICKNEQKSIINHDLLSKWGALYIDKSSTCITGSLLEIFDVHKHNTANFVLQRFLSSIAFGLTLQDIPGLDNNERMSETEWNNCLELRDEMLKWHGMLDLAEENSADNDSLALSLAKRSMSTQSRMLLKRLPIFSTLGGKQMVPLVAYDYEKNGYFPSYYITPGNDNASHKNQEWIHTSKWDCLLETLYGNTLLSLAKATSRYLLMMTDNARPELINFMTSTFFHSRLNDSMPKGVCLELLKVVGANKLAKRDNLQKFIYRLSEASIIVYEDGTRLRPCEVVDPADQLLVSILLKPEADVDKRSSKNNVKIIDENNENVEEKISSALPPPEYLNDKDVMSALRSLGCASLAKFDSFLRVAKIVALENNIHGGMHLCKYIVDKFNALGWNVAQWSQLQQIEFVPAYKINKAFFPYYSNAKVTSIPRKPKGSVLRELERSLAKKRKTNISKSYKSSNRRHKYTRQVIEQLLEDETTNAIDYNDDGSIVGILHTGKSSQQRRHSSAVDVGQVLCKSLDWYDVNGGAYEDEIDLKVEMIPFYQPDAILRVDAMTCWTATAGILPPCFDRSPIELLRAMGIKHTPRFGQVISHLVNVSVLWRRLTYEAYNNVDTEAKTIKSMQACIMSSMAILADAHHKNYCNKGSLRSHLMNCKFIVLDDGKLVAPREICVDLDDEMGNLAMPVPMHLSGFLYLLRELGALSIEDLKMPHVGVKGKWPLESFQKDLSSIFNNKKLSDVRFAVKRNKSREENHDMKHEFNNNFRYFYCHKLILGMASQAFMTFFSGGLSDSIEHTALASSSKDDWNGTTIHLDDWVGEKSLELFLKYIYGEKKQNVLGALPINDETISYCINILRLADMYFFPHLKTIMEDWLSSHDIIDVYNVVSLLTHASSCRAYQLLNRCVYIARQMYAVVSQTPEWNELKNNYPEVVHKIETLDKKKKTVD